MQGVCFSVEGCEIVRAILTLIFGDVWPGYEFRGQHSKVIFRGCHLNSHQRLLGSAILGEYFMGLQKMNPPADLESRANEYYAKYYNNIGNMVLMPAGLDILKEEATIKGYMDYLLEYLFSYLTESKKVPYKILDGIKPCKGVLQPFQGEDGFKKMVQSLLLDDFVDENYKPAEVFIRMGFYGKDVSKETYFEAVRRYLDFHKKHIPLRAQKMLELLKKRL